MGVDRPGHDPDGATVRTGEPRSTLGGTDDAPAATHVAEPTRLPPGTRVGRYALAEQLGAGGMGVVYRARDPELDRAVAIKVLRTDRNEHRVNDRFLREAQAMARLSHPNVVPIYDVGPWGSGLFLAMELVEGDTLRQWMQQPHGWREVVTLFVEAGRGLVEAHAAGIVHRDFKPENVLVDRRGRARVSDFGLARPESAAAPSGDLAIGSPLLTRMGTVLGTPAYMAPEQLAGEEVDARADVFAFAAALYEALHGHTPFSGQTFADRIDAIARGAVRMPNRRLPRWLLRAVLSGLAASPAARPDMATLLARLERGLARRRSAWLAAGLALTLPAGLMLALAGPAGRCEDAGERLAGLWDESTRTAVATALRASDRAYAEDTWRAVHLHLDAYTRAWTELQRDSCEAHARGEISAALLDRRAVCLGERRADLALTIDTLRRADVTTIERAVDAVRSLRPIAGCRDPEAELRDPSQLAVVETTRARIAAIRLLEVTGKIEEGLQQITEVETAAHADIGLRLEARFVRARLEQAGGAADRASAAAREVLSGAHEHGRDRLAVQAAAFLVLVDGHTRARFEVGEAWARVALAGAARIGDDGREEAAARQYYGAMLSAADRNEEALRELERALALRTRLFGPDDLDTSFTEMSLGNALWKIGRFEEARRHHVASVRSREAALGREHPALIAPLANLGVTAEALGLRDEARAAWSRSLALIEANQGPNHPNAAALHTNLGSLESAAGDLAAARGHGEAAVRIARATHGSDHPDTAVILSNFAGMLVRVGEPAAAEAALREALAITERSVGAEHSNHGLIGLSLGRLLRQHGQLVEARTRVAAALANGERTLGAAHPRNAEALVELAELEVLAGQVDAATSYLERAAAIVEAAEVTPLERARTLFALARALARRGGDAPRVGVLMAEVDTLARLAGESAAELRAEITAWRASP